MIQVEQVQDNAKTPTAGGCKDLMTMAERELAAFVSAVTELYGTERAAVSAEVWLDQLASMDNLPGCTSRDWRLVTVTALARLASRLTVRPASSNIARRPGNTKVSAIPSLTNKWRYV